MFSFLWARCTLVEPNANPLSVPPRILIFAGKENAVSNNNLNFVPVNVGYRAWRASTTNPIRAVPYWRNGIAEYAQLIDRGAVESH